MTKKICRICLRTDLETRDISDTLFDFHDEITEFGVFENPALKYCSVCEHQLLKFYKFSRRCRQANTILKTVKREKNGSFPANLHMHLPPSSFGFSDLSKMKLFSIQNFHEPHDTIKVESNEISSCKLEPNVQSIKEENDLESDSVSVASELQTVDEVQYNIVGSDELGNSYVARIFNVSEINNQDTNNDAEPENVFMDEDTGTKYSYSFLKDEPENDKLGENQKPKGDSHDSNEDSDTDMIKKFQKKYLLMKESKLKSKEEKKVRKNRYTRQPLKNLKELEKIFDMQLFASDEEAKHELELRKTSEPYLSAEHKCNICYTVYKYSKLLEYHKRSHSPSSGEYECSICYMRFRTKKSFHKHKYCAHFGKFKCKRCPLVTYQREGLQNHCQQHEGVIYACQQCDRTYTHVSTYRTHVRVHHKTNHVCETCARSFVSEHGLRVHRLRVHHVNTNSKVDNDAKVHCEPCNLTFDDDFVYTLHIMNTDKHKDLVQDIIACRICGARFENNSDLKQHRHSPHFERYSANKNCTTRKPIDKCPKCGVKGTGPAWLYHHYRKDHSYASYEAEVLADPRRVHMCYICGKKYISLKLLRNHINMHTGTKPHACSVCPKRFTSRAQLLLHSQYHEPAKRECPHCEKKFVSASNLSNHMRLHTQDRRFKCSLCHKGFLHRATMREHVRGVHLKSLKLLRNHINMHTGTKPHACSVCPKRFTSRAQLLLHSQYHEPAKRECPHCEKKFVSASNLSNHMRLHTQDRRFKCSLCHKGFLHRATMREHVRGVHLKVRRDRKGVKRAQTKAVDQ